MRTPTLSAGPAPTAPVLTDRQRTLAVDAILLTVQDSVEAFQHDIDEWASGEHPIAIRNARQKLVELTQRVDMLQALGRPATETDELLEDRINE